MALQLGTAGWRRLATRLTRTAAAAARSAHKDAADQGVPKLLFKLGRLNHVAIATPDLAKSTALFRTRAPLSTCTHQRRAASSSAPPPSQKSRAPASADAEEDEGPLRFSTSGAASWRARDTFGGGAEQDDVPWYQMPSVLISTAALLIYFCVLREESDIDERLGGGTAGALRQVPGLERQTLEAYVRHQEMVGGSVERERARLKEIDVEDEAAAMLKAQAEAKAATAR